MLSKKNAAKSAAVTALVLVGTLFAAVPANAMPPLTQDRDKDGIADHLDPDADNDGILNFEECNGSGALDAMNQGLPSSGLTPSMFGLGQGLTQQNLTDDISEFFGYPADSGAVIATIENAHTHPTADAFISGWNNVTNAPSGETRVQFTGTLGVYVEISPDQQWFSELNNDRKTIFTHDGTQMTDVNAMFGVPKTTDPAHPASLWTETSGATADGYRYDIQGPTIPLTQVWNYNARYVSQLVPAPGAPLGLGIASPTFDWGFDSQIHGNEMYAVMFYSLYTECDTDGDGIGDRLDREIDGEDDARTTPMNTPITVDMLANDPSAAAYGDHEVTGITQPTNGTVVLNADGTTTYTPNDGWTGVDTYTYDVVDALGQTYTQTVTITVPPQGLDDADSTPMNTPITVDVRFNDPTPGMTITSITQPTNGTVVLNANGTVTYTPPTGFSGIATFTYTAEDEFGQTITQNVVITVLPDGADDLYTTPLNTPVAQDVLPNDPATGLTVVSNTDPSHGTVTLNPDGTGTYTPTTGFSGTDTYTYTAEDENGEQVTQTVTIIVTPVGVDDSGTTPLNTPITTTVLSNDPTDSLTVQSVTQPSHGTTVLNADGTVTYTPNDGFTGTDTYTYTAIDSEGQPVTQAVTIIVTPVGVDDSETTPLNTPVTVDVLVNDPTDNLTLVSITQPTNGTATIVDGQVVYTPTTGFSGTDTFTYTATDAEGQQITQTVTILVTPKGEDDSSTTKPSTPVTIDVLDNDPTSDLTIVSITQPTNGTVVLNEDGTVTYTPNDGFSGTDTFTYTATDAEGQQITQTVTVTVPQAPVDPTDPEPPVVPGVTPPKTGEIAYTGGDIAPVIGSAIAGGAALLAGLWLMIRRRRSGDAQT